MADTLVIGGGLLGSHVAELLADLGHDVTLYSRSFNSWLRRPTLEVKRTIKLIEGTVPGDARLAAAISRADVVFYLAGTSTPAVAEGDPGGSLTGHVVPATAVIDLVQHASEARLVIASSGGTVYGAVTQLPTPEDHPTLPTTMHGQNSLLVEQYAAAHAAPHGAGQIILRYSNLYGPGQLVRRGLGVIAAWCTAMVRDEPAILFGDPHTRRDFLYVDDAAAATVAAAFCGETSGVYNVGSGRAVELRSVLTLIEAASGRPARLEHVAGRGVDVSVTELDCTRLRAATGWEPRTPLLSGIEATLEWVRQLQPGLPAPAPRPDLPAPAASPVGRVLS